jgi:hypothetical protein
MVNKSTRKTEHFMYLFNRLCVHYKHSTCIYQMNDLHGAFNSSEFEARMKYDHLLLPEILTNCFKTGRSTT